MEVQIITFIGRHHGPVLADEDKRREEYRFHGCGHRKDHEGGVEMRSNRDQIDGDPASIDREVKIDEAHAAGESGNRIRDLFFPTLGELFPSPAFPQGSDILPERGVHFAWGRVAAGGFVRWRHSVSSPTAFPEFKPLQSPALPKAQPSLRKMATGDILPRSRRFSPARSS